jgi:peptide/nickel transport system substrate-binding protein
MAYTRIAIVVGFLAFAAVSRSDAPATPQAVPPSNDAYWVLYVAVSELPDNLSPATAWTSSERQSLDLLFRRLVQVRLDEPPGQRYESDLALKLPEREGLSQQVELRRDAFWSDGERVTAADVRHTAQLLRSTSTWRELLEVPRFDGRPFALDFTFRHGFLDRYAPLGFYVLPEKYRGQALSRADDAAFAKAPVGSGPYVYLGRKQEGKRMLAVFGANPFASAHEKHRTAAREIRMMAWTDVGSLTQQPTPHVILDVPERSLDALKQKGYGGMHAAVNRRVYFLAVNHRVPALANPDLRRALAHAIARDKILQDCFRSSGEAAKLDIPLSGPFPAHCWAWCPPPRVPDDPYQPELARSLAKKVGQTSSQLELSLKYPAGAPGVKEACAAIAEQVTKLFADANVKITLTLVPLAPQEMRAALQSRDYELAYHHWDFADDNYWLWPLFDPHPDALRPGGSNFLGYDNDAKLQTLLRSAMSHRQFSAVRDIQHSIHAHLYERMPFIPLWQLSRTSAVHSSLSAPMLDPQRPFANILDWRISPAP